jgi:hypothetical protein
MILEIPDDKIEQWDNWLREHGQDTPENYPAWIRLIIGCVDDTLLVE